MTLTKNQKYLAIAATAVVIYIAVQQYRKTKTPTAKPLVPKTEPGDDDSDTVLSASGTKAGQSVPTKDYRATFNGNLNAIAKHASINDYNNFVNGFNQSGNLNAMNKYMAARYPKQMNTYLKTMMRFVNETYNNGISTQQAVKAMPVFDYLKSLKMALTTKKISANTRAGK